MHLPSLQPISDNHFYKSGNVTVHDSAAIAPGVLLQADPDSQLIIAAGVCIGMGTVLHAYAGTLEIGTGATLGTGVLVVGSGRIGARACIGSMATIFNSSIQPEQLVPSGVLICGEGCPQPQLELKQEQGPAAESMSQVGSQTIEHPVHFSAAGVTAEVYGRAHVEKLMISLFPNRRSLNPDG
jgi:carbon dioxide concentrating mechanism protein CcmN